MSLNHVVVVSVAGSLLTLVPPEGPTPLPVGGGGRGRAAGAEGRLAVVAFFMSTGGAILAETEEGLDARAAFRDSSAGAAAVWAPSSNMEYSDMVLATQRGLPPRGLATLFRPLGVRVHTRGGFITVL